MRSKLKNRSSSSRSFRSNLLENKVSATRSIITMIVGSLMYLPYTILQSIDEVGYYSLSFSRWVLFLIHSIGFLVFLFGLIRLLRSNVNVGFNNLSTKVDSTVESDLARMRFLAEMEHINDKSHLK
jgi:hypothetical protein